jgi:hypothetical protein
MKDAAATPARAGHTEYLPRADLVNCLAAGIGAERWFPALWYG